MICHHCPLNARILDTRKRVDGKARRRYRCAAGHTSVTLEHEPVPLAAHRVRGDATRARVLPVLHPTMPSADAAQAAGTSTSTIWRLRKEAGLPGRADVIAEIRDEVAGRAQALAARGTSRRTIARMLGLHRKTVARYLDRPR